ncbi:16S rRNA (uracil(1498)-N(3))-methyltransferase [Alcanivorax sp. HI0083]|uniref:16S rRNA (uracil(1498)-N(3))-methyltransferase n=2 Tax=Alcanivorax TaxID=59753 RepID=UPI0007BA6440|nr:MULTISPECIES: 16S rRNA (uracil(1498)-N(3))-methyltransferase [unclassified Alcanivorax]KZY39563.1 16S rRNA (uracil(1498)-N(3))-methyltransferase [Alcanivorax sp. HI0044]KZZ23803.1 16S rRNA (uracil(1498)-N(3))-methyltransferase [Alcanivorax sp. HI0083]
MPRRFFDDQDFHSGQAVALGASASHHIGKVLRMAVGEELVVFNGRGGEWLARITAINKKAVTIEPQRFADEDRTAPLAVTVALPMIKGERMDYAIQKATELGARSLVILDTERCEVRLKGERQDKKLGHWQQVAISACEQCGLNRVPQITGVRSLKDWLSGDLPGLRLIAHPGKNPFSPAALKGVAELALLTGPEGGFSDDELRAAEENGFVAFALGNRVLRAETAPVALLAALWAWHGR